VVIEGDWLMKRKLIPIKLFAFALLFPMAGMAQSQVRPQLESLLNRQPGKGETLGACVLDLQSGEVVFDHHGDASLVPASNMKLFAMAVALVELSADFSFETTCATNGDDLIVIGGGDPGFGDEKLARARDEAQFIAFERWADALRERGHVKLPGDLIFDSSIFEDKQIHPTWEEGDLGKWYAAPVSGLNINGNCLDITLEPRGAGSPARVNISPPNGLTIIKNRTKSGPRGNPILHHPPGTLEYIISGTCPKTWPFPSVAFPEPGRLFADSLRTALSKRGITIEGEIVSRRIRDASGDIPDNLTVVGTYRTPIAEALARSGKDSQNLFAECLLKRAGYEWAKRSGRSDAVGSWDNGAAAVNDLVRRAGIDATHLTVVDGSGLSRDNRCTARQLTQLLAWMHKRDDGALFADQLSEAGVDGSLRRRTRDLAGQVRAKTGTMRRVRTLSGYVDGDHGPRFAFAILFNDYRGSSAPFKKWQDDFCRILASAAQQH